MKSRVRVRNVMKWGGVVVTLLLVAAWLGSGGRGYRWVSGGRVWMGVGHGRAFVIDAPISGVARGYSSYPIGGYRLDWGMKLREPGAVWSVWVPLWTVTLVSLGITLLAWRLDVIAGRESKNACRTCGYDRAGLAVGAVCPECGAKAAG
jgi:hypothetical protein